jgi:hypothetical protein
MRAMLFLLVVLCGASGLLYHASVTDYLARIGATVVNNQKQLELAHIDKRLIMMETRLVAFLQANPSLSNVRIASIHVGITPQARYQPQWDIIAALGAPGHDAGDFPKNMPLAQWKDFLGALLSDHCTYWERNDVKVAIARMTTLGIAASMSCPIWNAKHQLQGAIFANWSDLKTVPTERQSLELGLRSLATQIATNLTRNE